jgi:glycosyltransferase involved in cell wall biosynthesis
VSAGAPVLSLSVVVCTYQGADFLGEQLESVARQTRAADEMVVVDDGSTDGTLAIAREFAARAPFPVRVGRNAANLGYAANFGRAIGMARGDVVVLADQDDVWDPRKLAEMETAFSATPSPSLVFSDGEVVDGELLPLGYTLWEAVGMGAAGRARMLAGDAFETLLAGTFVTGATLAFPASLRPLLLPVPPGVHHDAWIALLAAASGEAVAIPRPLIRYRQHGRNQIGAQRPSLLGRVRRARQRRFRDIEGLRMLLEAARERLQAHGGLRPGRAAALDEAIGLLRVRAGLPQARLRRVGPVVGELLAGRYRRRARGISSALRDLVA